MDDQYLSMLQYAAAVSHPLRIKVTKNKGEESQTFDVQKPYVLIGRHPKCDIVLDERAVSSRHLYLQAIGSRVAAIDLLSTTGTKWNGPEFSGWLSEDYSIEIPNTRLELLGDQWDASGDLPSPLDFKPRDDQRAEYGVLPQVNLELMNTSAKGKQWPINRVITLVGRDDRCRITILDPNISRVHCALLLLPSGLWVIDLMGRTGVIVNGQKTSCALLSEGTTFSIGPYQFAGRYPEVIEQMRLANESPRGEAEFLTKQNKIFQTESFGDTLVVFPVGDSQSFFYQDIHIEASRVSDIIKKRNFEHIVIDFGRADMIGHMIVESLMVFCRAVPGKAALCECNVAIYEMLQTTKLPTLYPHYRTRQDALQAVSIP